MTLDQVLPLQEVGGQVLDTRDPNEFAAAHLAGSINIGLGGQYADVGGDHPQPRPPNRRHRRSRARSTNRRSAWAASASITSSAI